jgi:hypothetical protein
MPDFVRLGAKRRVSPRRIHSAMERIAEHHGALSEHLGAAITSGTCCVTGRTRAGRSSGSCEGGCRECFDPENCRRL